MNGIIMTCAIGTHEGSDMSMVDIPEAFLNTKNDKYFLMCLREKLAGMMVCVDPKLYQNCVTVSPREY